MKYNRMFLKHEQAIVFCFYGFLCNDILFIELMCVQSWSMLSDDLMINLDLIYYYSQHHHHHDDDDHHHHYYYYHHHHQYHHYH